MPRHAPPARWHDGPGDDTGMTLIELAIASSILMVALGVFFAGLVGNQRTATFATQRQEALDDLRLTADTFAKEARQAVRVVAASPSQDSITLDTYVGGQPEVVTWRVVEDGPRLNLQRVAKSSTRLYVVRLDARQVFVTDSSDLGSIRSVRLLLATRPARNRLPVELTTEVALRNV